MVLCGIRDQAQLELYKDLIVKNLNEAVDLVMRRLSHTSVRQYRLTAKTANQQDKRNTENCCQPSI